MMLVTISASIYIYAHMHAYDFPFHQNCDSEPGDVLLAWAAWSRCEPSLPGEHGLMFAAQ